MSAVYPMLPPKKLIFTGSKKPTATVPEIMFRRFLILCLPDREKETKALTIKQLEALRART